MINDIILLKLGEIVLKGLNRRSFEQKLIGNINRRLSAIGKFKVYCMQSTIYVEPVDETSDMDAAFEALGKVFGIATMSRAAGCEKDDPTRYDMSRGRVCFPGAAPNETAEYPGYSNSDSTFYASMTFKQQPEGVAEAVIEVPVKLIGGASGSDRKIGVRVLEEGTTAQPGQFEILGAEVPAGKTYGAIRIEVAKSAELDTQQRELTLCLTDSPDLRVGPDRYLKANVSWHNMLPRPATTKQWSTYNAFIESEASSGSSSTEAYSQAGHQLLLDIFGWEVFPDWGPDYSYYIDAWRARAQAWYDEWKAANPGQKRIHESGSMKGREVTIRTK